MKNWEEVNGSPFRFWLLAVTAMLIFYTPEARSPWFVFAFACACGVGFNIRFRAGNVALRAGGGGVDAGRIAPLALYTKNS